MAFCFCFLAGVLVNSIIDKKIPFVWLYLLLFIIISFIIIFWSNLQFRFVLLCLGALVLGVTRYQLAYPLGQNNIANFVDRKMNVTGYVSTEPDIRQDRVNYTVNLQENLRGKIYFKYGLYPRFNYGDELKLNCELAAPEAFDDFRYDRYLANQNVFVICNNPQIEKIGEGKGNVILRNLLIFKNVVAKKASMLWNEPYAGFMGGLLYGYKGGLGELNNLFIRTGITHIVAVSGYNVTIIATALMAILISLYVSRKKAFWIIVSGIILFVIFSGASGSAVRAGVMGVLVLVSRQIGRKSRMANVLVFTVFFMVLINPFVLVWDAGFQLSFLSTLGLVYLEPVISNRVERGERSLSNKSKNASSKAKVKSKVKGFLVSLGIIECLSAILATLPLILFQFGRLSIVALPVNILVLWIIPFLMLGGFLAVVISFIFFPLGQIIAWITFVGMKYIVVIVGWFGGLKWAAIDITVPWWMMVVMYGFMIYFVGKQILKRN